MSPFDLVEPDSLGEALALLDPDDPAVRPIAGGTALVLMMKSGLCQPQRLVSLRSVAGGIGAIRLAADGALEIGAMVRLATLERAPDLRRAAPSIAEALLTHSNVRVRNVATLGGSLAHADPHMDLPPLLITLGARVRVAGPAGERTIAVEDLFVAYLETTLAGNELIVALTVPPQRGRRAAYVKCTARAADDWPALGIAAALAAEDGIARQVRIAIGAATPTAMRLRGAEAAVEGRRLDDAVLREAGREAAAEAPVVADQHGSAAYKRVLVEVYVRRALHQAWGGAA
ncbi:MAG TPA: xanthine dehydrogenase family protein subunit M [Acetobacteraceae bacterium]|nr:xanthine dehydrogenase family protein subunit M [Acetobacteraceae bacterium]